MLAARACAGVAALVAFAAAAPAWEARFGAVCTLTHEEPHVAVRLTYDPAVPEYTIQLTRRGAVWPGAPIFAMRFDGRRPNLISTHRQVISQAGATLTVTDRGFGNVLDGLQFNQTAHALNGAADVAIPLAGAAPEVAAFRACAAGAGSA